MSLELDATAQAKTHTSGPEPARAAGDALPAGMQLGHFRIERVLGAGGMGEVYLATDLALDRPVAIKVLPAGRATGAARDRLIREARAQARVHHPNVAHIYFIGEDDGRLYFAMEYLEGKTLADRVAGGPLEIDDALELVRSAALGLREAERSGFLHRDVKPSNLMLDAHGVLKVLDFGLVAANTDAISDGPVAQTSLAGTPQYMAPEQARGEPIDLRADIYALGATLFHLVSGRAPFVAESVAELASMHATSARPMLPKRGSRRIITAIDSLIARMMAPAPADRFASYDALIGAIELVSSQHTRPGGFWVRLFATGVDAMIVTMVCAAVLLPFDRNAGVGLDLAGLVYAIYSTVALAWRGTTPGKALFELELIATDGTRPRWQQVARRQLVYCLPIVMLDGVKQLVVPADTIASIVLDVLLYSAMFYGFADLAVGSWRRAGKRTLWDVLSHTQVRYRAARRTRSTAGSLLR
ncbi:MAG TPA: protein kinase [Kofleriaceae bacterium]|nr:protein kinase [Kofleriaceae bacterium]